MLFFSFLQGTSEETKWQHTVDAFNMVRKYKAFKRQLYNDIKDWNSTLLWNEWNTYDMDMDINSVP